MTKVLPCLYTFSIENISEKVSFYRSIGLGQIPIVKPVYLMQSVDLSYARYCFYIEKDIEIDMDTCFKLFINQQKFEDTYGLSNLDLINRYNYRNDIKRKTP
jgi:hypothetical protein